MEDYGMCCGKEEAVRCSREYFAEKRAKEKADKERLKGFMIGGVFTTFLLLLFFV